MKHLKYLFTALLMLCATTVAAHDFEVGGICYNILSKTDKTVEVTYYEVYREGVGEIYELYTQSRIVIPKDVTYNDVTYSVTSIGNSAFEDCTGLTSVTIPNSVTSIGKYAFSGCSGLKEVHISDLAAWCGIDFASRGANPLYCAHNLYLNGELVTDLVIPNNVTNIRDYAFYGCTGLTSVVIGNSVTSIGYSAFENCTGLKTVINFSNLTFGKGSEDYGYVACYADKVYNVPNGFIDGDFIWYENEDGMTLAGYLGNATEITLPDNYNGENYTIGNSAFSYCDGLKSITIPNSVISIGEYAFYDCDGLIIITIPNSVTSIGEYAFMGCDWLISITISNSVTGIGDRTFSSCPRLTSIEIPNSVTSIGNSAFSGCSGLTSIEIPKSVTSIGDEAFYGCTGLTSIEIPNSVTSIGNYAFWNCSGLTSVVIGNSVTTIGNRAFYGCTGLTSIEIPNSVTSIGDYAFTGCKGLKTVYNFSNLTFSKGSSNNGYVAYYADKVYNAPNGSFEGDFIFGKPNDVNTLVGYLGNATDLTLPAGYKGESYIIDADVFKGNTTITGIEIPNSVTSIENDAFSGCTSLTTVHISDLAAWCGINFGSADANPLYYAKNLYLNGEKLTELIIPDGIVEIKDYTFYNCNNLTSVVISNSVTGIGASAFKGCNNIDKLYIGSSVESIGSKAFAGCEKINEIKVALEKPIRGSADIFADAVYDNATLYIPNGTEQLYQKREPWNMFFYIVEIDFTGIEDVYDEEEVEGEKVQTIYDLQGRKVEVPSEGLYIINGKKVMIK